MAQANDFDVRGLDFFESGNIFTGSRGEFRFRIVPGDEKLKTSIYEKYCFEKAEILEEAEFDLSGEGYDLLLGWLMKKYNEYVVRSAV